MQLLVATTNPGKLAEIKDALKECPADILSLADFPRAPSVDEDKPDFVGNARKKAHTLAQFSGKLTLADDSGLIVPALGGRPGVHSARFAGPKATDAENVTKLLSEMKGFQDQDRQAYFVCVLVVADPEGHELVFEDRCDGRIAESEQGDRGFGYDPVFIPAESGKTFGEMGLSQKKIVSHRGKALDLLRQNWGILASLKNRAGD
jgi:XTP/dITP diphosphohydrolase